MTPEEEVVVLRRCMGAQEKSMNSLIKRIIVQDKALLNRKNEIRGYHNLLDWAIDNGRVTKEDIARFIKRKAK